jgi:hypothetical protein
MSDTLHPSHVTRFSDASSFDEICVNCGAVDRLGSWGALGDPCSAEPEEHRIARALSADNAFIDSLSKITEPSNKP